jgi:hypothetical protein
MILTDRLMLLVDSCSVFSAGPAFRLKLAGAGWKQSVWYSMAHLDANCSKCIQMLMSSYQTRGFQPARHKLSGSISSVFQVPTARNSRPYFPGRFLLQTKAHRVLYKQTYGTKFLAKHVIPLRYSLQVLQDFPFRWHMIRWCQMHAGIHGSISMIHCDALQDFGGLDFWTFGSLGPYFKHIVPIYIYTYA